jgi:hypothetical protein
MGSTLNSDGSGGSSNTSVLLEQAADTTISHLDTPVITQPVALPPIDTKFDGTNYSLWCQVVQMHVRDKEKINHLTSEPTPPSITDPAYQKWATNDVMVKGWIINSLESRLRGSYIRYPMARDVWKAIAIT